MTAGDLFTLLGEKTTPGDEVRIELDDGDFTITDLERDDKQGAVYLRVTRV
jgi:hypothetical protein